MNKIFCRLVKALTIGLSPFMITGCLSGPFSGSGSMRIEVEVYKGPLVEDPEIQWGKLRGYLDEARNTIVRQANFALNVLASNGYATVGEKATPISLDELTGKPYSHLSNRFLYLPMENSINEPMTRTDEIWIDPCSGARSISATEVLANDQTDEEGDSLIFERFTLLEPKGQISNGVNIVKEGDQLKVQGNVETSGRCEQKGNVKAFDYVARDPKGKQARGRGYLLLGKRVMASGLHVSAEPLPYLINTPTIPVAPEGFLTLPEDRFGDKSKQWTLEVFLDNGEEGDRLSIMEDEDFFIDKTATLWKLKIPAKDGAPKTIGTLSESGNNKNVKISVPDGVSKGELNLIVQHIGFDRQTNNHNFVERTVSFVLFNGEDKTIQRTPKKIVVRSSKAPGWCQSHKMSDPAFFECSLLRDLYFESVDLLSEITGFLNKYHKALHENVNQAENDPACKPEDCAPSPGNECKNAEKRCRKNQNKLTEIMIDVSSLGSRLAAKGFQWAVALSAGSPWGIKTRIAVVNFITSLTEFGNQIIARADALMKQRYTEKIDRRELSLSAHLRNAEPTGFVHLYDWMDASTAGFRYKIPAWLFTGYVPNSIKEQLKVVDRLYRDHYWSKVNTVYASGKGKVSLVFVKDGIGNWSLRNMDNAPGELLDAYKNFSLSLMEKAGELAAGYATGGISFGIAKLNEEEAQKTLDVAKTFFKEAKEARSELYNPATQESIVLARLPFITAEAGNQITRISETDQSGEKKIEAYKEILEQYKAELKMLASTNAALAAEENKKPNISENQNGSP